MLGIVWPAATGIELMTIKTVMGHADLKTTERWAHIVARHPDLSTHRAQVLDVVRAPDRHGPRPIDNRER